MTQYRSITNDTDVVTSLSVNLNSLSSYMFSVQKYASTNKIIDWTHLRKQPQKKKIKDNSLYRGSSWSCKKGLKDKHNSLKKFNVSFIIYFPNLTSWNECNRVMYNPKTSKDYSLFGSLNWRCFSERLSQTTAEEEEEEENAGLKTETNILIKILGLFSLVAEIRKSAE